MNYEELIEKIGPKLKAIARKVNTRFTFFDDEDLYQEAVIHLWQKLESGELDDKTDSYILQGCFFFLKNYIRVSFKTTDRLSSGEEGLFAAEAKDGSFGFTLVDVMVDDILDCLEPREKEVFLLSLEEMTTREIGSRLGISHVMVVRIEKNIREKCLSFRSEVK